MSVTILALNLFESIEGFQPFCQSLCIRAFKGNCGDKFLKLGCGCLNIAKPVTSPPNIWVSRGEQIGYITSRTGPLIIRKRDAVESEKSLLQCGWRGWHLPFRNVEAAFSSARAGAVLGGLCRCSRVTYPSLSLGFLRYKMGYKLDDLCWPTWPFHPLTC